MSRERFALALWLLALVGHVVVEVIYLRTPFVAPLDFGGYVEMHQVGGTVVAGGLGLGALLHLRATRSACAAMLALVGIYGARVGTGYLFGSGSAGWFADLVHLLLVLAVLLVARRLVGARWADAVAALGAFAFAASAGHALYSAWTVATAGTYPGMSWFVLDEIGRIGLSATAALLVVRALWLSRPSRPARTS